MTDIAKLKGLFNDEALDIDAIGQALDAMSASDRVAATRSLGGKLQARLWEAAAGRGATIADVVPEGVDPSIEVIHAGKNSLPVFTHFEKRFCRVPGDPSILYGYNEGAVRPVIGPGYFVVRWFEDRGEVGVDYYSVPPDDAALPAGWPAIQPNERGLQRLVYAKMIDYLRRVSSHVTIGRAYKKGAETGNYFLLCRTGV